MSDAETPFTRRRERAVGRRVGTDGVAAGSGLVPKGEPSGVIATESNPDPLVKDESPIVNEESEASRPSAASMASVSVRSCTEVSAEIKMSEGVALMSTAFGRQRSSRQPSTRTEPFLPYGCTLLPETPR
eukprot:scaffold88840_cov29-Tisochrysis_lutea.AAC.1